MQYFCSPKGDLCCFLMEKKSKKPSYLIHIADFSKKNIEVNDMDIQQKLKSFAFEFKNQRFAAIVATDPHDSQSTNSEVIFYAIEKSTFSIREIGKYGKNKAAEIMFSPNASFFVLFNRDQKSPYEGYIEFGYFVQSKDKLPIEFIPPEKNMNGLAFCNWDSTGRLFITGTKQTSGKKSNITIFNGCGEQLFSESFTGIDTLLWRYKPKNLISPEKEEEIFANYKEYKKTYADQDDRVLNKMKYEKEEKRKEMQKSFLEFINKKRKEWDDSRDARIKIKGYDEDNLTDFTNDEIIEKEELIEPNKENK